jgi:hypothetical protein
MAQPKMQVTVGLPRTVTPVQHRTPAGETLLLPGSFTTTWTAPDGSFVVAEVFVKPNETVLWRLEADRPAGAVRPFYAELAADPDRAVAEAITAASPLFAGVDVVITPDLDDFAQTRREQLADIAAYYVAMGGPRRGATKAVMQHYGVSRSTASRLLAAAREEGLLAPKPPPSTKTTPVEDR